MCKTAERALLPARGLAQWRARCAARSPNPPNRNPVPGRHRISGPHLELVGVGKIRAVVGVTVTRAVVGVGVAGSMVAGGGVLVGGKRVGLGIALLVGVDVAVGRTDVLVGTDVPVGDTGVQVGGTGVAVGGGWVAVGGGTAVADGLTWVGLARSVAAVVGTGVADGGT
jgi:hypothetical protein